MKKSNKNSLMKFVVPFIYVILLLAAAETPLLADYSQAFALYRDSEYDAARTAFLEVVQTDPSNSQAWFYLGEIEKATKHFDKSVTYYMRAIQGNLSRKNMTNAYWSLMVTTEQQKNYPAMVRACRIYWQKTGDDSARKKIDTLLNRALWSNSESAVAAYNEGVALLRKGSKKDAVSSFYRAMQLDSSFLAPRFEIGMIAYREGDNDLALRNISVVADRIFYYTTAQQIAASLYEDKQRYDRAIIHYTNILEFGFISSNERHQSLIARAQCNLRADRLGDAMNDIDSALSIRDTQSVRLIQVAVLIKSRKYSEADSILQKETEKDPANPELLYQRGSLQYLQKNDSYIDYFEKLFTYYRNRPSKEVPGRYHRSFRLIAREYYSRKNYETASAVFMYIPDSMLENSDKINLARSLYYSKRYSEALARLEKLKLTSEDKLLLIKCHRKIGNEEKAYDLLKPIVLSAKNDYLEEDPDLGSLVTRIRRDEAERLRKEAEEKARLEKEKQIQSESLQQNNGD